MADPNYCATTDPPLYGLNPGIWNNVPATTQAALISARSRFMDGYFAQQFTPPLVAWLPDVTIACVQLVAFDAICYRGYNPDVGADVYWRDRFDDACKWLEKVSKGIVTPRVTDSSAAAAEGITSDGPIVISSSSRGFSTRPAVRGGGANPFQGD